MGFLDPGKILVILVIALIVLGPERLPRMARQAGAAWRELTRVREQVTEEIRSAIPDMELPNIPRLPTNMVSGFIADLTKPSVSDVGGAAAGADEVQSEVDGRSDALFSSSSTGEAGGSAEEAPSWLDERASSGALASPTPSWSSPGRGGTRLRPGGASGAEPSFGEVPLVADDPGMN